MMLIILGMGNNVLRPASPTAISQYMRHPNAVKWSARIIETSVLIFKSMLSISILCSLPNARVHRAAARQFANDVKCESAATIQQKLGMFVLIFHRNIFG
jgi:hypothetical protein